MNIPIKLASATKDRDIHFHMLHKEDGARIKFKRVCPEEGREVPNEEIVRGYELGPAQYVTFTDEELEAAAPQSSRTVEIVDFVRLEEIDPSYYNKSYYVLPDKNASKAYHLLLEALRSSQKVGIARMVMREKEYLVAIRPKEDVLVLETMHFADEVVPSSAMDVEAPKDVDKRQLDLAQKLIESLTTEFDPARYQNEYRERVMSLIDQKAEGREIVVEPEAKPAAKTTDLMAALERSLASLKGKSTPGVRPKAPEHAARAKAAEGEDDETPAKGRRTRAATTHAAAAKHAKDKHARHGDAKHDEHKRKGKAAA